MVARAVETQRRPVPARVAVVAVLLAVHTGQVARAVSLVDRREQPKAALVAVGGVAVAVTRKTGAQAVAAAAAVSAGAVVTL